MTRAIGYFARCATRQVQLLRRQREIAEILIEECAEVTQWATKLMRFGVDEIGDVIALDRGREHPRCLGAP